jgi:EAL domain-containing protein (putative c-di-GMP-specific phosphodiesterase class I)
LALDDVGPMTTALAMLPVLSADLIKLDLTVTQASTTAPSMKVLDIAFEEAERTGATILAEGIETDDHLRQVHRVRRRPRAGELLRRTRAVATRRA